MPSSHREVTIAEDVIDAMNPALTADQRLTAINHALMIDGPKALAMATSLGQVLIRALGTFGLSADSVIEDLRRRVGA